MTIRVLYKKNRKGKIFLIFLKKMFSKPYEIPKALIKLILYELHWLPLKKWLASSTKPLDYVLIQGDFGASYLLIQFALSHDLIPVYSTTARQAVESMQPDGSMKVEHLFKHQIFRKYGY